MSPASPHRDSVIMRPSLVFGDVFDRDVGIGTGIRILGHGTEFQMLATGLVDEHGVAVVYLAGEQHARQLIADLGLHQTAQRTSAVAGS